MGTSLSHQEELFLNRQWAELLQDAMAADLETLAAAPLASTTAAASSSSTEKADGSNRTDVGIAHKRDASKPKKSKKKDGFQMSFQEWQALLSTLEQKEASSTPSDIAARLTTAQLHVPVVALMVHVCAWWRGAISSMLLKDRLEQLVNLVYTVHHGHGDAALADETEHPNDAAGAAVDGSDGGAAQTEGDSTTTSRRTRLARFVREKVVDRARHRSAPSDGVEDTLLGLDTFDDLTCLVQELQRRTAGDASPASAASTGKQAQEVVELYDEKIGNADALRQRPVLAVVMVFVLAVFASTVEPKPQLAARSVAHLEALEALFFASASAGNSPSKPDTFTAATTSSPLVAQWPVVGEFEAALVHRQHEADVTRCLSSEGDALMDALRQMRRKREALRGSTATPSSSSDPGAARGLSASERWAAGASQYVGQRPIWTQLRSHYLSAGVFDADKPTVLVFFGPSGYGKSELAKRVASVLHDCPMSELESSGKMVYIHMPSFCTKDSIYSLVDPPAAHVGSGILLSALQQHPDAVVVLDEFEKSTAESINNLWLSAFQKNGVLRSLKEASRSVSTVRTTFILTCNTCADTIAQREDLYLGASPADQETIRNLFVTQCKDVCRETMGDPFVNRVDYFFPFMPYTRAERRQFVCLLLERLLSSQETKGRHLHVTPSFVEAMVGRLHTFHAATLEEAVRSQVMEMVQAGWPSAVLTVERRIGGTVIILLPTTASTVGNVDERGENGGSSSGGMHSLVVEAWDSLPGGAEALQKWEKADSTVGERTAATPAPAGASPSPPTTATPIPQLPPPAAAKAVEAASHATAAELPPQARQSSDSLLLEKRYAHEYVTDKARVVELETELEKTRDLVKQRDLEIVTLKEKVLLLQKALAVVVLALMSCLCLLAVVIGLKLTLLFALAMVGVAVLALGVPLRLLLEAVQALFRVLGPFKGGVLVLLFAVWIAKAYNSVVSCS